MKKLTVIGSRILSYGAVLALSVLFVLPFFWMVRSSLMKMFEIFIMPPIWIPPIPQFKNYVEAMTILPFLKYFGNTFFILVLATVGVLLTASLSAFGFSRIRWKGRELVFSIILTSMMLPAAATLIPQFIGWKTLGFYNTFVPLILPAYFGGGAFNIFLLRQFFMTIPTELDEAARVDGAGYFRIYWKIILPLSRSALIVVSLFAFMYHWNDFFGPLIYIEGEAKFTLALGLQQFMGNYNAQWHLLMAASTVVILPPILVFIIGQKYFLKGIVMTGLKG